MDTVLMHYRGKLYQSLHGKLAGINEIRLASRRDARSSQRKTAYE